MTPPDEIEKLERRWQENQMGLVFTPLAEAYRRRGNAVRALTVLQTGLTHHPEYIPALVVLGRCHLDLSNLAEAEDAFARILASEPGHGIALRGMAEVYQRSGRVADAVACLEALLEVDPDDHDARSQVERLRLQVGRAALAEPQSGVEVPAMAVSDGAGEPTPPFEEDAPLPPEGAAPAAELPEFALSGDAALEPDGAEVEPELVVTESMAELFLRQGHRELALAVYRQLVERSPDPRLQEIIQDLESARAASGTPSVPVASAGRGPADARSTGGRSVEEYLRAMLEVPPPTAAAAAAPYPPPAVRGEPTRAVEAPLSLGAVFGDDPPPPPAPSASAGTSADALGSVAPGPSYDEFFGAAPAAEPAPPAETGDDLARFNEWLRGLTG
jgi:tetratricopeptide (TPR) repeat protein